MAGDIHRDVSSPLTRDGPNRSEIRRRGSRRTGQRGKEPKFPDDHAVGLGNHCRKTEMTELCAVWLNSTRQFQTYLLTNASAQLLGSARASRAGDPALVIP